MQKKMKLNQVCFMVILACLFGCVNEQTTEQECSTYECRRKELIISLQPNEIELGQSSTLLVKRKKFFLPEFHVLIGEFDENFNLPIGEELQYFEDSDSVATLVLIYESIGIKKIRGIIEEYKVIGKDSADTYRYPFEIELIVKDSIN